jgi:hypothetical protein
MVLGTGPGIGTGAGTGDGAGARQGRAEAAHVTVESPNPEVSSHNRPCHRSTA